MLFWIVWAIIIIGIATVFSARAGTVVEPNAKYTNRSELPEIVVTKERATELVAEHIELLNRRVEVVALRIAVSAASNVATNRATAWDLTKRQMDKDVKAIRARSAVLGGAAAAGLTFGAAGIIAMTGDGKIEGEEVKYVVVAPLVAFAVGTIMTWLIER